MIDMSLTCSFWICVTSELLFFYQTLTNILLYKVKIMKCLAQCKNIYHTLA